MSTIRPDPSLDRPALDLLGADARLDALHGREAAAEPLLEALEFAERPLEAADPGEALLDAPAWDDVPVGERRLGSDPGLTASLGARDLAGAADAAVEAVLGRLGRS